MDPEYDLECQETVEVATSARRGHQFPLATIATLTAYHRRGMVGVGKGRLQSLDWTGGLDRWTGLDWTGMDWTRLGLKCLQLYYSF